MRSRADDAPRRPDTPFNSPGDRGSVAIGRTFTHGEKVCISVQATDYVGIRSGLVSSDCATCDSTPPFAGGLNVGADFGMYQDK